MRHLSSWDVLSRRQPGGDAVRARNKFVCRRLTKYLALRYTRVLICFPDYPNDAPNEYIIRYRVTDGGALKIIREPRRHGTGHGPEAGVLAGVPHAVLAARADEPEFRMAQAIVAPEAHPKLRTEMEKQQVDETYASCDRPKSGRGYG